MLEIKLEKELISAMITRGMNVAEVLELLGLTIEPGHQTTGDKS